MSNFGRPILSLSFVIWLIVSFSHHALAQQRTGDATGCVRVYPLKGKSRPGQGVSVCAINSDIFDATAEADKDVLGCVQNGKTDTKGYYTLQQLPTGTWYVFANLSNYIQDDLHASVVVSTHTNEVVPTPIYLREMAVRGNQRSNAFQRETDKGGFVSVSYMLQKERKSQNKTKSQKAEAENKEQQPDEITLTGRIVDREQRPLIKATASLYSRPNAKAMRMALVTRNSTDEAGKFKLTIKTQEKQSEKSSEKKIRKNRGTIRAARRHYFHPCYNEGWISSTRRIH